MISGMDRGAGEGARTIGHHSARDSGLASLGLEPPEGIPISLRASEVKEDTTESLGDISERLGDMVPMLQNTPGNIWKITERTRRVILLWWRGKMDLFPSQTTAATRP